MFESFEASEAEVLLDRRREGGLQRFSLFLKLKLITLRELSSLVSATMAAANGKTATANGSGKEREIQKSYWEENSTDLTVESMMLDSKASTKKSDLRWRIWQQG